MNPDYLQGQSTSLKAGLHALPEACEAAVVLLGDQPGIRPDAIDAVVGAFQGRRMTIVQAAYGGLAAHPTLLPRGLWGELDALTGDEGARGLVSVHPTELIEVGGEPPYDIDTEEDYLRALWRQQSAERG